MSPVYVSLDCAIYEWLRQQENSQCQRCPTLHQPYRATFANAPFLYFKRVASIDFLSVLNFTNNEVSDDFINDLAYSYNDLYRGYESETLVYIRRDASLNGQKNGQQKQYFLQ